MASPSPSPSPKKYDVFLSFRGEDTRYTFTSHLHKALFDRKIETYIDERLERGDEISHALLSAIEESKLSVIIFSENYASSPWCLDELVHILRRKEMNMQIVLPVFYHVSPSDVRKQRGSYAVALATLEERFKDDPDKVNQWRAALTEVANLSGWDAPITRPESELVDSIVKDVVDKLRCLSMGEDFSGLVGPGSRIIITTRNKQVLENIEVDKIYKTQQINEDEALQLFCLNAFRRNSPTQTYLDLSRKAIDDAAGWPLALKVLGSHLNLKSKDDWETALRKLKLVPSKKVERILQISYDGLNDNEKDVLLDLRGKWRRFLNNMLDDCGLGNS